MSYNTLIVLILSIGILSNGVNCIMLARRLNRTDARLLELECRALHRRGD